MNQSCKHLWDIKVTFSEPAQPMCLVLEFHFEPNDYFTNLVLTKTYKMNSELDKADSFSFEGTEIVDGCTTHWKKVTKCYSQNDQGKAGTKGSRHYHNNYQTSSNNSFFNFFNPLKTLGDGESLDEDSKFALASDFEIGHFLHEQTVPWAVLYFTGEATQDDNLKVRKEKRRCQEVRRREQMRRTPKFAECK